MNDFTRTGKCIWCGKTLPDVSFKRKPHIVPKSLGGSEIGVDVCDDCNHFFGTSANGSPSMDLAFKEVFNAFNTFGKDLTSETWKTYKSNYFSYYHGSGTIKRKKSFDLEVFTRQFKRSLYEIFLQEYHYRTNKGNDAFFDFVRKFARYGIGDLRVYYAFNNMLFTPSNIFQIPMSDTVIKEMYDYGVFQFWFMGHVFYLEINPLVFNLYEAFYLTIKAAKTLLPILGNEKIIKLENVMDLDFFLQRFNPENY